MPNTLSRWRSAVIAAASALIVATVPAAAQLSAADKTFVSLAAQGNNFEIAAARLASSMASDPAVKAFAQMMIDDHTNLGSQLKAAVNHADPQFKLPVDPGGNGESQLEILRNAGKKFDSTYKAQMIAGHTEVRMLFQQYVDSDKPHAGVRIVIVDALPAVQKHLDAARGLPGS